MSGIKRWGPWTWVEAEGASGGRVLQAGSCLGTAPMGQKGVSPCPIHTLHPSVHLHHSPQTSPTARAEIFSWQGIAFFSFFQHQSRNKLE